MHETYEDVTPGETVELGTYEVTREEIISFAESYDPQPFHVSTDHDAPFEGVIASGWHTAAMTMRLLVEDYLLDSGAVGSPGLDGLRWLEPVRPGDVLSATVTCKDKELWDDSRGLIHQEIETHNENEETVMWMDAMVLFRRQ